MAGALLSLSACASVVSEDTCLAGNWEAVGFSDGSRGKSADRLAKIAETCTEYGVSVDNQNYWAGYEKGLTKYCTFEKGYERGESGASFNQVCSGELAAEYGPGFEEGRQTYLIYKEHDRLIDRYYQRRSRLQEVRQRLQNPELTERERRELRYRINRLENEVDNLRYNIREFERQHGLPRHAFNRNY